MSRLDSWISRNRDIVLAEQALCCSHCKSLNRLKITKPSEYWWYISCKCLMGSPRAFLASGRSLEEAIYYWNKHNKDGTS